MRRAIMAGALGLAAGLAGCGDEVEPPASPDAGQTLPPDWVAMDTPGETQLLGVWGRTSTEAYAVGWDGAAFAYDGERWRREATTATVPLTEVAGAPEPGGPVVAVGWAGTLLARSPDGTWGDAPRTSSISADLFGVHLSAPDFGLAVGDRGTVLRWDGTAWAPNPLEVPSELSGTLIRPRTALAGVFSPDGRRWYISGAGGASFRSNDAGATFEALDTRESVPLRGVWGPGGETAYTVGLEGVVLRFAGRWRRQTHGLGSRFLFGVWGASDQDLTVVGWQGTILRRFAGTWYRDRSGTEVDLRDVWQDPVSLRAFAVGARGTLLTRTSTEPRVPEE